MSLLCQGPGGSIEQRWITYALLCDNVQHHLEGCPPTQQFKALHGISRAVGARSFTVLARELHQELARAQAELIGRPISELAISHRTRAVVRLTFPIPCDAVTMLVRDCPEAPPLPPGARTLDDVFGHLLRALLRISDGARDRDVVEVTDL